MQPFPEIVQTILSTSMPHKGNSDVAVHLHVRLKTLPRDAYISVNLMDLSSEANTNTFTQKMERDVSEHLISLKSFVGG